MRHRVDPSFLLPQLLGRRAAEAPTDPAVLLGDGTAVDHRELHRAAVGWAHALRGLGVGPGDHVVTLLPSGPDAFAAWLGIAWLRAVEVPLNGLVGTPPLAHGIADCAARAVLTSAAHLDALAAVAAEVEVRPTVVVVDGEVPADHPFVTVARTRAPDDEEHTTLPGPAAHDATHLTYTSGTTGPPKGVVVPWAQLYFLARFPLLADEVRPGEGLHTCMPVHHGLAKISLYLALVAGGHLVLSTAAEPTAFWDEVRRLGCTNTIVTPHMAAALLAEPPSAGDRDHPLRGIVLGPRFPGIEALHDRFGVRLRSWFGGTELNVVLVTDDAHCADWRTNGRPPPGPPGMEVRVVDEHDQEVPAGAVGELVVRTAEPWALNAGYHGRPEQTARVWRNGWYHSGDAFRCDETGEHSFVDRVADLISRDGSVVSSIEIDVVLEQHPGVAAAAAIGVPAGAAHQTIVAYVVPAADVELTASGLDAFSSSRLPWPQVPDRYELVEALPRTPITQKVRKSELRMTTR